MNRRIKVGSTNRILDMKWIVTGLILVFLSCNGQKNSVLKTADTKAPNADNLLNLIVSDSYSGADTAETLLINDVKGLKKFYSKINKTRKPGLPIPDIDFTKESVIIRCSGKRDDSSVPELYIMDDSENTVIIGVKRINIRESNSALTTPFSVYKMPLTDKEVIIKVGQ